MNSYQLSFTNKFGQVQLFRRNEGRHEQNSVGDVADASMI